MEPNSEIQLYDDHSHMSSSSASKEDRKMNKKLAKAVNNLLSHEGKFNDEQPHSKSVTREIFSDVPTTNLWIYHFGIGEDDDYKSIYDYFTKKYGGLFRVFIFPGQSYGLLGFDDKDLPGKIIPQDKNQNQNQNPQSSSNAHAHRRIKYSPHSISFPSGTRTVFLFFSPISAEYARATTSLTIPEAFACAQHDIPGLFNFPQFISKEEEMELICQMDTSHGCVETMQNRKISQKFVYEIDHFFPDFLAEIMKKDSSFFFKEKENDDEKSFVDLYSSFDRVTIQDFLPGQGMQSTVEPHSSSEELFCVLSLNSGTVMMLLSHENEERNVYIPSASLLIFTGEARFAWQRSISSRKFDKVDNAIIFRKRNILLTFTKQCHKECSCTFLKFCDSDRKVLTMPSSIEDFKLKLSDNSNSSTFNKLIPTEIEKKHVYDVYDKIAPHFSHTRYKPWPKVAAFLNSLPPGSVVADVGCGNGKYFSVNEKIFILGTDRSHNLIAICRERINSSQVFSADSLILPLRSNTFDSVISIAVVHHFSNDELRLKAISEIFRILKPGGSLLIYVWAFEQPEKKITQQDNFVPWHLQSSYENEKVQIESLGPEIVKDEKKNSTVYHRYYHFFKHGEIEALINQVEGSKIIESYYDHENWCCIACKE